MVKIIEEILNAIGTYKLINALNDLSTAKTIGESILKVDELITIAIHYPIIPTVFTILTLAIIYIIVRIYNNPLKGPDKKIKPQSTIEEQNQP